MMYYAIVKTRVIGGKNAYSLDLFSSKKDVLLFAEKENLNPENARRVVAAGSIDLEKKVEHCSGWMPELGDSLNMLRVWGATKPNNNKPASHMRGFGDATMNNEKLKQIRESITNTVSCINSDNGDLLTNVILNGHLKNLTDIEAVLLRTIHINDLSAPTER